MIKRIFSNLLLMFGFCILYEKNALYTIIIYFCIFVPIIGILILNYIKIPKKQKKYFLNDLKYFFNLIMNIQIILFIVYFIICCINNYSSDNQFKNLYINVVYFMSVISLYIFLNYYGTRLLQFRKTIKFFLDLLIKFIKENFILNLFLLIFIMFFKNSKDLLLGILGSYLFFFLTEINENYKNRKKLNYNDVYLVLQIIMNIILLLYIVNIEIILSAIISGKIINLNFWFIFRVVILIIAVLVNYFAKSIKNIYIAKVKKIINNFLI